MVKFRAGTGRAQREQALSNVAKRLHHFGDSNIRANGQPGPAFFDELVSVDLKDNVGLSRVLRMLEKNGLVEYAEENAPLTIVSTIPDDVDFPLLWGLNNTGDTGGTPDADIDMPEAWDLATGSSSVVVAVIDTGIDYTHPDLMDNIWGNSGEEPYGINGIDDDGNGFVDDIHGYDFYNNDGDPLDDHFHGTHCAGTIGAVGNNATGVAGVNWHVSLMALKFLSSGGSGYTDDAVAAIEYAINNGADVLSNSWGGGGYSQALQDAISAARAAGLVFIAAAGNSGTDSFHYPAANEDVIAVSATDHNDAKAGFSSYGSFVDVAAPGVNIYSTDLGGGYRYASGTSMACPHVAGLAALLLSADDSLSPDQLEAILETSADDLGAAGWDTYYGAGRINAYQALQRVDQQLTALPSAVIASPGQGAVVSGAEVEITGTAAGPGFSSYTLEYADREGTNWQPITSNPIGTPVGDGVLASWDTSSLADDDYLVRLTVSDGSRQIYDVVLVTLDRFEAHISFPKDLVSMGSVEILGSAATLNDLPFDSYTLEWGVGSSPSNFSSTGITLAGGGLQPVSDGVLATWDTSTLVDGQTYTLQLTVHSAAGFSSKHQLITKADGELVLGWPQIISFDTQPSIADLDGDESQEIIVAGSNSAVVHAYRKDGSELPGFPANPAVDIAYFSAGGHSTVTNIDGGNELEILVAAKRQNGSYGLYVIGADGSSYPGWVAPDLAKAPLVPVAADMDGDGDKEIVTIEIARWAAGYSDYTIHAFDLQGNEISGFPVTQQIDDIHGSAVYFSVHDLDGDNLPELALLQDDKVLLFDHTGALIENWPYQVPTLANGDLIWFDGVLTSGDIDGDGLKELVALSSKSCEQIAPNSYLCFVGAYATLYAWNKDASVVPGFPRTTDSDGFVSWMSTAVPVIDIDNDGNAEVLPGSDPFMIFDGAGNTVSTTSFKSAGPLSVFDGDGDNLFEYASGKSQLQIFTDGGAVLWSRSVSEDYYYAGILLADLDDDGSIELVKAMPGVNPETNKVDTDYYHLYVWEPDLGGTTGGEWPMFAQNERRDGSFSSNAGGGDDLVPPTVNITSPEDGALLPAGDGNITIEADASDLQSGIERVEFQVDGIIACTDYTAPYSCATVLEEGGHTLTAVAFDFAPASNSQSDTVTVEVASGDTTPPTVGITSPEDGTMVPAGDGNITIEADASDLESGINRVEFQVDGVGACTDSTAPYSCATLLEEGSHTLMAMAFDNAGNSQSDSVTVEQAPSDTTPPTVSITSPVEGAVLAAGTGGITIEADASDLQSGMDRVEFQVDGVSACTDYTAPYACTTLLEDGSHTLTAIAFDNAGNSQSDSVTVNQAPSDTTPPTVSIVSPEDGANLSRNGHVTIEASASDAESGIQRVEFALDGLLVCTLNASPYVCDTQVDNGEHALTARAFDHADNSAEAGVTVTRGGTTGKGGKK